MKQIYNFEQYEPPILSESILKERIQEKKATKAAILAGIAGFMMQVLILLAGFIIYTKYPVITMICIAYVIFSVIGGSVISIIYSKKGVIIQ